jgi:hypothetical protein
MLSQIYLLREVKGEACKQIQMSQTVHNRNQSFISHRFTPIDQELKYICCIIYLLREVKGDACK